MSQQLDDRTGAPMPQLSAKQREQRIEAIIAQMNLQTRQINALTSECRELRGSVTSHDEAIQSVAVSACIGRALNDLGLLARLRWLVTGR